ncbi:MAG: DUF445 family protein [Gemmatimonadetes bacterium]|nr:DUF445 family protein [Gemmatimonadota bacterium]
MTDLSGFWTRLGLDVVLGSVSGGVTSWVAVVLIFRPYERTFGLHGAIPKNKARLAKTIGRTVGERLLTVDDILAELRRSGLRDAIERKLGELATELLDTERGPLRELLPPAMVVELERALQDAGPGAADAYAEFVATEEFEAMARAFVARSKDEIASAGTEIELAEPKKPGIAARASGLASGFINDMLAKWVVRAARTDRARALAAEAVRGGGVALLDRPLGRLSRWLPDDAPRRMVASAAPAILEQIEAQLPALLETVDIPGMVERKVLGFSTQRVEEIVRGVTQRELNLIVQLGYVLGGIIGLAQFTIERWFAR